MSTDDPTVAPPAPPADPPIPEVLDGPYSYVSGPAGTGKTFLAKEIVRQRSGTLLCATTGIASVNLGEGTTINAALGYFDTASLVDAYQRGSLTARLGKLWRAGTRRILLDEVSMMDAEQLTIITRALEELRGRGYVMNQELADEVTEETVETDEERDRRGIALTVIGDFLQLPPVKAPFAFTSGEWERYHAKTHKLTAIRRQSDPAFIAMMQAARGGKADPVCDYFRGRLESLTDHHFDGLTVVATNDAAERLNGLRLDRLPGPTVFWPSTRWGKERGDWKNIPERLGLRQDALVMVLANHREVEEGVPHHLRRIVYANGDLGHIVEMDAAHGVLRVRLDRTGEEVVVNWVTRQNKIPLEPGRRAALQAEGNGHLIDDKWEIVGEVTYLPVRLAYAATVHKVQGLSMDKVQVATHEGMFRNPGMLYVALSRARTPQGLRLVGHIDGLRQRVSVHPEVRQWV